MPDNENDESLIELFEEESRPMTKSERTRLKIMASAAKVFNEKGFDSASIQDIANDAGIAKGTIYYYVDKKEDILLSLLKYGKTRLFGKVEKDLGRFATASDKIDFVIRNHLKIMKTVGPIIPFFAQSMVAPDSRSRDMMSGFREEYLDLLESIIKEGIQSGEFRQVDTKRTAVAILALVVGQMLQYKLFHGKINAKVMSDTALDIALNGLRSRNEG